VVLNYKRLYEFRSKNIKLASRQVVWNAIASDVYKKMGEPERVLDPAAGRREFINAIPSKIRYVIDLVQYDDIDDGEDSVSVTIGNVFDVDLPQAYFDGVFISNFLEHLSSPDEVAVLLQKMYDSMMPGGRIAILGPNFKYAYREYFDCADHILALSHIAVEEHLYAANFTLLMTVPRFLPFSFRGMFPISSLLTKLYLRIVFVQKLFGKQFLVIAQKPER
jgi:SAM-dependent methyltransferase